MCRASAVAPSFGVAAVLMLMAPTLSMAAGDPASSSPDDQTILSADEASPSVSLAFSLTDLLGRLNGSRWMVELHPLFGRDDDAPAQDLLTFDQQLVTSQLLAHDDFQPARFTVTMTEEAAPVWEAMQSSATAGIAIWRGELHGEEMRGTVSKQPLEGTSQDYQFVGHQLHASETPPSGYNEEDPEPKT